MAKDEINKANEKLNELFKVHTFDDATHDALIYFTGNKDKLKYLLLAYPINQRHVVLLDHLEKQFGKINRHMLTPFLNKELIFKKKTVENIAFVCALVLTISSYAIIMFLFYSGFVMATATLFLHLFVLLFIWGGFGTFTETHVRTYFLSSDYKSLAKPKQSL